MGLGLGEARHVAQEYAVVGREVAQAFVGELRFGDDLGPGDDVSVGRWVAVCEGVQGGANVCGRPGRKAAGRLAVDEQHRHRVLDRYDDAASVVAFQAVVIHLDLDDVLARIGKSILEGDADLFTAFQLFNGAFAVLAQVASLASRRGLGDEKARTVTSVRVSPKLCSTA